MNSTAKLGAFMIAALIVLGFFILRIEQLSIGGGSASREFKARFPSVSGLNDKSAIRIAGVKVGVVRGIALERGQALVTLQLDPNVTLHTGARAIVRSMGLLGEQYVELEPGAADGAPLADGTVLSGGSPAGMDKLFETANDIGGDIKAVTTSLRNTIGGADGQAHLEKIVANIEALTAELRAIATENRSEVNATLANFKDFSATLRREMPKLAEKLNSLAEGLDTIVAENRTNVSGSLSNVREISEKLKVSADDLNAITGKIAKGEGSVGKLVNDSTTVDNLNSTLKSVESGITTLKDSLGRASKWELDVNLKSERLTAIKDAPNNSRASFDIDLHTTDRRFYRVGLVKAPRGKEVITDTTITTSFDGGPERTLTERTISATNEFSYNAQVGYRLWDRTTVRAGLFESEGGVAVDQVLVPHKADVSFEAYHFGRSQNAPHIRAQTRWFVTPNLYAYAGYDDPLRKENRSLFIGAGITWKDDDVKYLLGTAASAIK